jgi:enamine deaminase RidA (YjgF/YER057c/UK114 family)
MADAGSTASDPDAGPDDLARVSSGSPFEPTIGFSRAVRLGDRVLVSGTGPVPPRGERCPEDAGAQARRCFDIVETALAEAGAALEDVVRTRMYVTDVADAEAVGAAHGARFGTVRPAATMVVVAGLLDPAWKVEVEAEAVVRRARAVPAPGVATSGPGGLNH